MRAHSIFMEPLNGGRKCKALGLLKITCLPLCGQLRSYHLRLEIAGFMRFPTDLSAAEINKHPLSSTWKCEKGHGKSFHHVERNSR